MKKLIGKNLLSGEIGKIIEGEIQDLNFSFNLSAFKETGVIFSIFVNFLDSKEPKATIYLDIAKSLMEGKLLALSKRGVTHE